MNAFQARRVLVTGASGFIGANLVRALLRSGADVHALTRPESSLRRLAEVIPRLTLHRMDLAEAEAVQGCIKSVQPQVILHLAATPGHPARFPDRAEALRTSVVGTFNLLSASAPLSDCRFVHVGSWLEYGPKPAAICESDLPAPSTFRGAVKAAASLLCGQFARETARAIVVLRLFSVYGYWESPARFIPTVIRAALHGETISLTPPGYRKDFVFVEDVVDACLRASEASLAPGEIFNIGSGRHWRYEEVVDAVQSLVNRKVRVQAGRYPPGPTDTDSSLADIRKAAELLGWSPRHTLQTGIGKTIDWLASNPDWSSAPHEATSRRR